MAIEKVNVGASPDDGTGDPVRTAFQKANQNFEVLDQKAQDLTQGVSQAQATGALAGEAAEMAQDTADSAGQAANEARVKVDEVGARTEAVDGDLQANKAVVAGIDAFVEPQRQSVEFSVVRSPSGGMAIVDANGYIFYEINADGVAFYDGVKLDQADIKRQVFGGQEVEFLEHSAFARSGLKVGVPYILDAENYILFPPPDVETEPVDPVDPVEPLPPIREQQLVPALLGDSRTANAASPNPQGLRTQVGGWLFWAEMFSMGGIRFDSAFNFAIAGQTSTQIVARAEQAAKSGGNCVIYHASVNDALGEDSIGNAIYARDLCLAEGKPFIIIAETPRGVTSPTNWDAPRRAQHARYREAILSWRGMPGVRVVDVMPSIIDPYSSVGGFKNLLSPDGLHYTCHCSLLVGKGVVEQTKDLHVPVPGLVVSNADLFDASYNPRGNLLSNGLMAGSSGTHTGTGSIVGPVADGWSLNTSASYTGTSGKEVIDGREWQRVTFSGTASNASQEVSLLQSVPIGKLSAGDFVECMVEIAVDAGSVGMYGPELNVKIDGVDNVLASGFMIPSVGGATSANPTIAYSGLIRTPRRYAIQAGIASLAVHIRVRGRSGEPMSGSFRVTAASLRKIQASA